MRISGARLVHSAQFAWCIAWGTSIYYVDTYGGGGSSKILHMSTWDFGSKSGFQFYLVNGRSLGAKSTIRRTSNHYCTFHKSWLFTRSFLKISQCVLSSLKKYRLVAALTFYKNIPNYGYCRNAGARQMYPKIYNGSSRLQFKPLFNNSFSSTQARLLKTSENLNVQSFNEADETVFIIHIHFLATSRLCFFHFACYSHFRGHLKNAYKYF